MAEDRLPAPDHKTVSRSRKVVCERCDQFELGKRFKGASATAGEREWVAIVLPEECPVCGAETTVVDGEGA